MKTEKQMAANAAAFAERWKGRGYERGESQLFWADLLTNVYGVENLPEFIRYEEQVKNMVDATNFIDGHIPSTRVLIEQKSLGKDLRSGIRQSDGSVLNPFQQAKKYVANMPLSQHPRWIITCNFTEFLVYDMEQPNGEPEHILLGNLGKEYYRLLFLVDTKSDHLKKELEVSMKAGEIVGQLYEELLKQYIDPTNPESLKSLNVLCVRLVFCLYAEDAGIFGKRDQFHDYLAQFDVKNMRIALMNLFKVLDTPIKERDPYLDPDLATFPYANGGLFSDEHIEIPFFNDHIRQLLLQNASLDFDWSEISPTIFGAVFESTLNPETRRSGGMHYTSIENIHKVIDPLFLNDLRRELDTIVEEKVEKTRNRKLDAFQDKLASLTFLDPACGSGNFLTETFLSLRRLENELIRERYHGQTMMGAFLNPVKVNINQFYGIEINDFAVTVATTALWISEAQMLAETERIIHQDIDFLPLKTYHNIREGNALRMDWDIIEKPSDIPTIKAQKTYVIMEEEPMKVSEADMSFDEVNLISSDFTKGPKPSNKMRVHYNYIMGNPPFVGYSMQTKEQKNDIISIFVDEKGKPFKTAGKIDYVAGWYYKASQLMQNTETRTALVSTNSITQGEQVAAIWKPLKDLFGIHIDFAYRTFQWDSEASQKAHVHCVIIGFSCSDPHKPKTLFDNDKQRGVKDINPYLIAAPDIFVESRKKPLCDVPEMMTGNRPADGGHLIIETEDYSDFISREPKAKPYIKRLLGAAEFINHKERWCLWLVGVSPAELRKMPLVMKRIDACKQDRENAPDEGRRKLAATPHLFRELQNPDSFIAVPKVSSERRRYIPMDYLSNEIIPTDLLFIIPDATLYHFGVLESNVHMAWMRAVCGRLKSDYRYSKDIVYNNFPWPKPTESQRQKIEQTARAILDARALYPDSSLADLYDELTMPPKLRKAHQANDRALMEAYGFNVKTMTESQCVAELFKRYQIMTREAL